MKRAQWILAAALVLALAGCGKFGTKGAAPETAPAATTEISSSSANTGPRLALIIAQTDYKFPADLPRVTLAEQEADAIHQALTATGFTRVRREKNLPAAQLAAALSDFRIELEKAGPTATGFVYYTGHGVQNPKSGQSFLLGTDAQLRGVSDIIAFGVSLEKLKEEFEAAEAYAVFLVFDACRNIPAVYEQTPQDGAKSGFKGAKGITRVDAAEKGMLIAYSTDLNDVATEGVYAPVLARELVKPGRDAESAFAAAQRAVYQTSGNAQKPWYDPRLFVEFCFAGCGETPGGVVSEPAIDLVAALPELSPEADRTVPEMVTLPLGRYFQGSPSDEVGRYDNEDDIAGAGGNQRQVQIDYALAVGKYEVTWDEWQACVSDDGCPVAPDDGFGKGRRPVTRVSWYDTQKYIAWLNSKQGLAGKPDRYRLLSEAEWEYAARARTKGRFSNQGGEADLCAVANGSDRSTTFNTRNQACSDGFDIETAPVGSFAANGFGLYDMHGNVWEWVEDCHTESFSGIPADGSAHSPGDCFRRGKRGGCFDSEPRHLRSAVRDRDTPESRLEALGFRVARTLLP